MSHVIILAQWTLWTCIFQLMDWESLRTHDTEHILWQKQTAVRKKGVNILSSFYFSPPEEINQTKCFWGFFFAESSFLQHFLRTHDSLTGSAQIILPAFFWDSLTKGEGTQPLFFLGNDVKGSLGKTAHRECTDLTREGGKSDGGKWREQQRGAGSSEQL